MWINSFFSNKKLFKADEKWWGNLSSFLLLALGALLADLIIVFCKTLIFQEIKNFFK